MNSFLQFKKDLENVDWFELLRTENGELFDEKWASFLKRASNLGFRAADLINQKRAEINDAMFQDAIKDEKVK